MSQENIERLKRESSAMNWVVGLVAALVVYVASPMPVAKVLQMNDINPNGNSLAGKFFVRIYAPLGWASTHNKLARKFYDWEAKLLGFN